MLGLTRQPILPAGLKSPPTQPWLQLMQGRICAERPARALFTSSGSAMVARTIEINAASPLSRICSACSSVVMRPVTMLGKETARATGTLVGSSYPRGSCMAPISFEKAR